MTEAERTARQQRREQAFMLRLAEHFNQAVEEGRDITDEPPAEVLRLTCLLEHNAADQQHARQWGYWAEELRLATEAQALDAALRHEAWKEALCTNYGRLMGRKLAAYCIEPGMTLEMVAAAFGAPGPGGMTVPLDAPELCVLRYGSPHTATVIELRHGVVTRAQVGAVGFPEYVYDWPDVSGS
ncbi:hypothetical protein [Hymenobacter bucti]|uniref:DUF2313 domain-containing protein n=1 Tax=Hymenobacter bucti TaxID=1844114 RepID=A0ABW4QWB8_9BACT